MMLRNRFLPSPRCPYVIINTLVLFFVVFLFPVSSFSSSLHDEAVEALNKKSYQKAIQLFEKDAKQGNSESQFMMGTLYSQGMGVKKNLTQAAHWHEMAAKHGHLQSQYVLAIMYRDGEGVTRNPMQAVHWLEKASQHGSSEAQYTLAAMYESGDGIPHDTEKAHHLYEEAAKHNHPKAQTALGLMAIRNHTPPRFYEALAWFEKAAALGDALGQCRLGILYETGRGVPRNHEKAAHWYKKAVKQGDLLAHNKLGFLYYNGQGVPQDYILSYALFKIANDRGDKDAFQNTYIAASFLPPKLFERATALAKNPQTVYMMIGD